MTTPLIPPLTADQSWVLRKLAEPGGRIEARRLFPSPFHFHLITASKEYAKRVSATTVALLLELGLLAVRGSGLDELLQDSASVVYLPTPAAARAVAVGSASQPGRAA